MKLYELTYLSPLDSSEEKLNTLSQNIRGFIIKNQGNVEKTMGPNKRELGVLVKDKAQAYLSSLDFNLNVEPLNIFRQKLGADPDILRYIITEKKIRKEVKKRSLPKREVFNTPQETGEIKESVTDTAKSKKVELKEIDEKIEEILND